MLNKFKLRNLNIVVDEIVLEAYDAGNRKRDSPGTTAMSTHSILTVIQITGYNENPSYNCSSLTQDELKQMDHVEYSMRSWVNGELCSPHAF